jgi:hypothetical protein
MNTPQGAEEDASGRRADWVLGRDALRHLPRNIEKPRAGAPSVFCRIAAPGREYETGRHTTRQADHSIFGASPSGTCSMNCGGLT